MYRQVVPKFPNNRFAASPAFRVLTMPSIIQHSLTGLSAIVLSLSLAIFSSSLNAESSRPRIGLVLSGGGALGLAHIGVIEVFEELRVPVDCISGTSMGAMVGGSYAAGVRPADMRRYLAEIDIAGLFNDEPERSEIPFRIKRDDHDAYFDFALGIDSEGIRLPAGVSSGYRFELFLNDIIGTEALLADLDFDDLPTPFRAVATDLESGEYKVFRRGSLAKALRASMSLPAIVAPAEVDGHIYVDGGLSRNLPVDVARDHCADIIVAVDLGTAPMTGDQIENTLDVALQTILLLTDNNVKKSRESLSEDDLLIVPDLQEYSSSSFGAQDEIIQRGRDAAHRHDDFLNRFSLSEQDYRQWREERLVKRRAAVQPGKISVLQDDGNTEQLVLREIETTAGNFDARTLNRELVDLFGRGNFDYLGYQYHEQQDQIVIDAKPKSWKKSYLKLGLSNRSDLVNPSQLDVFASYRKTSINARDAEWRNDIRLGYHSLLRSEFIQPMQLRDGAFAAPYVYLERDFIEIYSDDLRLGDVEIRTGCAGLRLGVTGIFGEISIAPNLCSTISDPELGILNNVIGEERLEQPGIRFEAILDQLDSFAYPRSGTLFSLEIDNALDQWGADQEFSRLLATLGGAVSFGEHTIAAKAEIGEKLSGSGSLPPYRLFQLGGPRRLAGLYIDQLTGSEYDLVGLSYYYRFSSLPAQLGRGQYVGLSLESGSMEDPLDTDQGQRFNSISVFWGAETVLGAAYIGIGATDDGQEAGYFTIGPRF